MVPYKMVNRKMRNTTRNRGYSEDTYSEDKTLQEIGAIARKLIERTKEEQGENLE